MKKEAACKQSLSFIFAATDYCKNFKMAFGPFISEYIFLPTFFFAKMQGSKEVHYFFIIFHFLVLFANTLFHVRRPFVLWSFTLLICRVVYQ